MSATDTDAAKDPLEEVGRVAEALGGADAAVQAYQASAEAKSALQEQLRAAEEETLELGRAAKEALEESLSKSKAPLREARKAVRQLQGGAEEQALQKLSQEVEARRAALEGLREKLEPLAEAAEAAEANLVDSKEMLSFGESELEKRQAEVARLEAEETEARAAYEKALAEAEALNEVAREARETSKLASAKLVTSEAYLEDLRKQVLRKKSSEAEAQAALEELQAKLDAAQGEAAASEDELGIAKAGLKAARKAQLESSQALARVETPDEEEKAEAAASEALNFVAQARKARDEAQAEVEAKQALVAEAEAARAEGEAALQAAADEVARAEDEAQAAEAALEEQRSAAGLDEVQAAGASAHAALELSELAEAALKGLGRQLDTARESAAQLTAEQEELRQASRRNEAFVAGQQEELARAQSDVDAAQRALEQSEAQHKSSTDDFSSSRSELQQLLTALARVEKQRDAYELLLEELGDEVESNLVVDEPEEFADTGAWGNLDSLFDPPEDEVSSPTGSDTEAAPASVVKSDFLSVEDAAPPPPVSAPSDSATRAPSFRLSVSLPGSHLADYDFAQEEVRVGRDSDCDVVLDSPVVSRNQFSIRQHEGLFALIDAGTANGTFINGKRVAGLTLLNDGDGIGIGKYRLRFLAETHAAFDLADRLEKAGGVELGGMTLRITPEESRRQDGEHDRVRGYLLLPNPKGSESLKHPLGEVFSVGKDIACDLVLSGWFAPKRAAIITRGYDRFTLINVSPSGRDVSVNGEVVRDHRRLSSGDKIEIYGHRFVFQLPSK